MLKFSKMHGLGNDFIVIDNRLLNFNPTQPLIRKLADRKFGIGCDQLLLIEPNITNDSDFNYRIFNSTGEEVEHCGNGARCVIKYLHSKQICNKDTITLQTKTSTIIGQKLADNLIEISMGIPDFKPISIPFNEIHNENNNYNMIIEGKVIQFGVTSIGNPHVMIAIQKSDFNNKKMLENIAQKFQQSKLFPNSVNVNFYLILNSTTVQIITYERGCGFTLSCGTGACATVAYNIIQKKLLSNETITVITPGGNLNVIWDKTTAIKLQGSAEIVFDGQLNPEFNIGTINEI